MDLDERRRTSQAQAAQEELGVKLNFGDRVTEAIAGKGNAACVGLDPLLARLPPAVRREVGLPDGAEAAHVPADLDEPAAEALYVFGREVLRTAAAYVPVVKLNSAFFERYHAPGVRTYGRLVADAHALGLLVIGDVKRADIGHSATQYALAQLGGPPPDDGANTAAPDAVTVNPYLGFDGVGPFVDLAKASGRGLFVLVQTSNATAADVQGLVLAEGGPLSESIARMVQRWATQDDLVGRHGYSCVGAVVAPRDVNAARRLRALMPACLFLVPGFGAQGFGVEEVATCFKPDGTGALVNASRSVIFAYEQAEYRQRFGDDWRSCIAQACRDLVASLRRAVPPAG